MTAHELRAAFDQLGLSEVEAARLLHITPNQLLQYLQAGRRIPGPLIAAVEAWQRHGPPPGARIASETLEPGKLKLMKKLRDSLATEPDAKPRRTPSKPSRWRRPGSKKRSQRNA